MNKKIKVAIIGCGARGVEHAAAFQDIPEAAVWALCDPNAERLRAFPGSVPPERRFADIDALLRDHVPDLVHLITPPTVRLDVIQPLVEAGVKALIIEKPFASSLAEARQIVDLCTRHGVRFVVNHQLPYMPSYRRSKQLLDEGVIGAVERVRITCNGTPYEQGTHMLDLAGYYLGGMRPQRVLGQMAGAGKLTASHPSPEWMVGRIVCENGVAVDLVFGDIADPRVKPEQFWVGCRIEIFGTKGVIDHKLSHGYRVITGDKPVIVDTTYDYGRENTLGQLAFTRSVLRYLADPAFAPPNSGESALLPIALLESVIQSSLGRIMVNWPVEPVPDLARRLREALTA